MKTFLLLSITSLFVISGLAGCAEGPVSNIPPVSAHGWTTSGSKTLRPFRSEQELKNYLKELAEKQKEDLRREQQQSGTAGLAKDSAAPAASVARSSIDSGDDESVTNVQHAGVDEGGILKLHGDHLVVLRRGRLFTVKVGDGALTTVSAVDAFGPDIDPRHTWYDEMLVSENTIAVIGYSYARGGTEIGLFQIDPAGQLSSFHLSPSLQRLLFFAQLCESINWQHAHLLRAALFVSGR